MKLIGCLRSKRPTLSIVVMTGFMPASSAEAIRNVDPRSLNLVFKPFHTHELIAAVEAVLAA